jgi:hypothetical protein
LTTYDTRSWNVKEQDTKGLGAKENHGIQNIAIDNFTAQKDIPTENLGELFYRGPIRA